MLTPVAATSFLCIPPSAAAPGSAAQPGS